MFSGGKRGIINTVSPLDVVSQWFIRDVGTASRCAALTLLALNELTQVIDWGAPPAVTSAFHKVFF